MDCSHQREEHYSTESSVRNGQVDIFRRLPDENHCWEQEVQWLYQSPPHGGSSKAPSALFCLWDGSALLGQLNFVERNSAHARTFSVTNSKGAKDNVCLPTPNSVQPLAL
jgi:hypothetical protein